MLSDAEVLPPDIIHRIGVHFDTCMTILVHDVGQLIRSCFYQLHNVKLSTVNKSTAITLFNSFIVFKVDYFSGLTTGTAYSS